MDYRTRTNILYWWLCITKSSPIIPIRIINEHNFTNNDVDQSTTVSLSVPFNVHRCFYQTTVLLLPPTTTTRPITQSAAALLLPYSTTTQTKHTRLIFSTDRVLPVCSSTFSMCATCHPIARPPTSMSCAHFPVSCIAAAGRVIIGWTNMLLFLITIFSSFSKVLSHHAVYTNFYVSHYASIMCILFYVVYSSLWLFAIALPVYTTSLSKYTPRFVGYCFNVFSKWFQRSIDIVFSLLFC